MGLAAGSNERQHCLLPSLAVTPLMLPELHKMCMLSMDMWHASVHGSMEAGCSQPSC